MKLRKGQVLVFAERSRPNETIVKASNNPINGMVKTDRSEYSTDFIIWSVKPIHRLRGWDESDPI